MGPPASDKQYPDTHESIWFSCRDVNSPSWFAQINLYCENIVANWKLGFLLYLGFGFVRLSVLFTFAMNPLFHNKVSTAEGNSF